MAAGTAVNYQMWEVVSLVVPEDMASGGPYFRGTLNLRHL